MLQKIILNFEDEKDLENLIKDKNNEKEMIEMAEKDLSELIIKKDKYENELKIFLLPKDKDDDKNAIVEIRAGTGGLEASFFVPIYLKCMKKFVLKKWQLEIINISKSDAGGFQRSNIFS